MFLSFWQSSILRKKPMFMHLSSYCISFRDAALISTSDTLCKPEHEHILASRHQLQVALVYHDAAKLLLSTFRTISFGWLFPLLTAPVDPSLESILISSSSFACLNCQAALLCSSRSFGRNGQELPIGRDDCTCRAVTLIYLSASSMLIFSLLIFMWFISFCYILLDISCSLWYCQSSISYSLFQY